MAEVIVEGKSTKKKGRQLDIETVEDSHSNKLVKAKDIARKIKSFEHFIYIWGHKGGYYMPPKNVLTWHYVSQILAREKWLLRVDQVGHALEVPKVRGTVVNDMYHLIKRDNGLEKYFPDLTDTQNVPRDYFFNVQLTRSCVSSTGQYLNSTSRN